MKNPSSGNRIFPCGQTERHDEANSRLSQFYERAQTRSGSCQSIKYLLKKARFISATGERDAVGRRRERCGAHLEPAVTTDPKGVQPVDAHHGLAAHTLRGRGWVLLSVISDTKMCSVPKNCVTTTFLTTVLEGDENLDFHTGYFSRKEYIENKNFTL